MKKFLYRQFKLKENGSNIRTEIVAGITTFFTMAYIIMVNPSILSSTGMTPSSVLMATCIVSAIGCFIMGFVANYPFGLAPGMGLNVLFAVTLCGGLGLSWQAGLAAVFISGVIFILLTVTNARTAIVKAIPSGLKKAIGVGIGFFIAYVGLANGGVVHSGFGTPTELALFNSPMAIMTVVGILITVVLMVLKVRGAIFIGILSTTAIAIITALIGGDAIANSLGISFAFDWSFSLDGFGQFVFGFGELFDFSQGVGVVLVSVLTIFLSISLVDLFGSIGTMMGVTERAGVLQEDGSFPRAKKAFLSDGIATFFSAIFGTSTVTTYVESTAGISQGGRTGLTAVVVGILFLLGIVLAPFVGLISYAATAPALIIVGVLMVSSVKTIKWDDLEEAIPCFLTILVMTLSYSIADGIAFGFISHTVIQIAIGFKNLAIRGKKASTGDAGVDVLSEDPSPEPIKKKAFNLSWVTLIVSLLFIARYIFIAI